MNLIKALLSLTIIAAICLIALFVDFSYKTFSATATDKEVDAIVVLTGGKGRVEEGLRLFREKKGRELFLIGVNPSVRKHELYVPKGDDPPDSRLILEKQSRNTLENAIYGRDLLMEHKVRSILLITSRYHLKRSAILFRNALPEDVAIYPYPIDSSNLKESWWSHQGSLKLLFSEFYKYCLLRAFFTLSPGELRGMPH